MLCTSAYTRWLEFTWDKVGERGGRGERGDVGIRIKVQYGRLGMLVSKKDDLPTFPPLPIGNNVPIPPLQGTAYGEEYFRGSACCSAFDIRFDGAQLICQMYTEFYLSGLSAAPSTTAPTASATACPGGEIDVAVCLACKDLANCSLRTPHRNLVRFGLGTFLNR